MFVHLTAGDAGLGNGLGGRKHPFYLARENGAEAAIRFMADADAVPGERIAAPMSFNGHMIYRVQLPKHRGLLPARAGRPLVW